MKNKEITKEEADLIFKGIRPEHMSYNDFDFWRRRIKDVLHTRLKGIFTPIPKLKKNANI